jgi:thermitase
MQWHLPTIHGPEAWALTTGAAAVMIAIIDSGIDNSHPDVGPKILPGWNFVSGSVEIEDYIGHGTAVAGAIGAASDNGLGITGVTWNNPLLPIVVVDNNNYASYSDIASAIHYAVDRGARIINISLGGTAPSAALQSAVDYAWAKGSLVFAAAMNDGQSIAYYPAACNHAVAVSATNSGDRLADFSNYGDWIALSAPGANILSTARGGGYGFWDGTSFAAPIAAGVAALALAANPQLDAEQLLSVIENSADDLGPPGRDPQFGWGRVNAYRAVQAAIHFGERQLPPHVPVSPPTRTRR